MSAKASAAKMAKWRYRRRRSKIAKRLAAKINGVMASMAKSMAYRNQRTAVKIISYNGLGESSSAENSGNGAT
jgi:hypothetical protein